MCVLDTMSQMQTSLPMLKLKNATLHAYVQLPEGSEQINLKANDLAIFTLGSITADSRYGGNHDVPALIRHREDHGWTLWETLAQKPQTLAVQ